MLLSLEFFAVIPAGNPSFWLGGPSGMRSNREAVQALRSYSLDNVNHEGFIEPTRASCFQAAKR